jgi:hypothetical protein
MKIWMGLILLLCFPYYWLWGQQASITFEKKELPYVFQQLEKQFDLTFAFDQDLIHPLSVKKHRYQAESIEELLDQILIPLHLSYRITAQKYVLIRKKPPPESDDPPPQSENRQRICGFLQDALTGDPLPYGTVQIKASGKGVASDDQGFFTLEADFHPSDSLLISYIGYQSIASIVADLLDSPCKRMALKPAGFSIPEIVIRDFSISFLKPSRLGQGIQLNPDQIGRLPGWGENDILRMAQLLPGIHSSNESAADIHIRGGTPDQNLILWEDIPILHVGHFFGMFTAVNPNISESIKIYPGNFDAGQGGRVSGLIDIRGPEATDSLTGQLSLNLINAQAYLNIPVIKKQASLQLAFRRSYTDIIQSPTYKKLFEQIAGNGKIEDNQQQVSEEGLEALLSPRFYFNDINAKWDWEIGHRTRWTSSFYRGSDHLDYLVLFDEPFFYLKSEDEIDLSNTGASTVLSHQWSSRLRSNIKWIHSNFQNDYRFSLDIEPQNQEVNRWRLSQNNDMQEDGLQWNNSWIWRPGQSLNFGYHRSAYRVSYTVKQQTPNEALQQFDENIRGTLHSMYLDLDLNLDDRLLIDFGFRHIRYAPYKNFLLLPRLSVNYEPFDHFPLQFKANIGRYTQFMNQMITGNELGLSERIWIIAGAEQGLPLVQSEQWSTGLRFQKKGWIFEAEYYEKESYNLTSLNLQVDEAQNNPYSLGQADIRGIDVLLRKKWRYLNTWLAYSLGEVRYTFPGLNGNAPFWADHDQRHTLKWTNLVEYPRWGLSASLFFHSGRPFTVPEQVSTYYNADKQAWEYELNFPPRNESRLPAYQRIDLSAYWRWSAGERSAFIAGISVFNVLNKGNIRDKRYYVIPPDETGTQPAQLFQYDQLALGMTPNVFIEWKW